MVTTKYKEDCIVKKELKEKKINDKQSSYNSFVRLHTLLDSLLEKTAILIKEKDEDNRNTRHSK